MVRDLEIGQPINSENRSETADGVTRESEGRSRLYDKISREDILIHAFAQCRSNKGAPGIDGQDFADVETYGVERWLGELALALRRRVMTEAPPPGLARAPGNARRNPNQRRRRDCGRRVIVSSALEALAVVAGLDHVAVVVSNPIKAARSSARSSIDASVTANAEVGLGFVTPEPFQRTQPRAVFADPRRGGRRDALVGAGLDKLTHP